MNYKLLQPGDEFYFLHDASKKKYIFKKHTPSLPTDSVAGYEANEPGGGMWRFFVSSDKDGQANVILSNLDVVLYLALKSCADDLVRIIAATKHKPDEKTGAVFIQIADVQAEFHRARPDYKP